MSASNEAASIYTAVARRLEVGETCLVEAAQSDADLSSDFKVTRETLESSHSLVPIDARESAPINAPWRVRVAEVRFNLLPAFRRIVARRAEETLSIGEPCLYRLDKATVSFKHTVGEDWNVSGVLVLRRVVGRWECVDE